MIVVGQSIDGGKLECNNCCEAGSQWVDIRAAYMQAFGSVSVTAANVSRSRLAPLLHANYLQICYNSWKVCCVPFLNNYN